MATFSVRDLVLASPAESLLLRVAASGAAADDAAAVAAGQSASFVQGLSVQNQRDVLDSTLLAQLAASGKYDRYTQIEQWYNEYIYVLTNIGWTAIGFNFQPGSVGPDETTVDQVVFDYMKSHISDPAQLELLRRTLDAMRAPDNKKPTSIFISSSVDRKDREANFQIGSCIEDDNKNVIMAIGAFIYAMTTKSNITITHTLFTKISLSSAQFKNAFQVMTLDSKVYATYRQDVLDKLAGNAQTLIDTLIL